MVHLFNVLDEQERTPFIRASGGNGLSRVAFCGEMMNSNNSQEAVEDVVRLSDNYIKAWQIARDRYDFPLMTFILVNMPPSLADQWSRTVR